jgi:hypothetical protein
MENKLYICKKTESLNCFLDRVKGHSCFHSEPHEYIIECNQEVCIKTNDTYKLRGCSCKVYEEENN